MIYLHSSLNQSVFYNYKTFGALINDNQEIVQELAINKYTTSDIQEDAMIYESIEE